MSKLQELTSRREELIIKIARLWDELMEVNEYVSEIEEAEIGEKKQQTNNSREL
jgi:hypothetical protein